MRDDGKRISVRRIRDFYVVVESDAQLPSQHFDLIRFSRPNMLCNGIESGLGALSVAVFHLPESVYRAN